MTVTQMYAYDEFLDLSPYIHTNTAFGPRPPSHPSLNLSAALAKTALIGNICNNSFRNEHGTYVGQATEVALLNVLPILNLDDDRKVCPTGFSELILRTLSNSTKSRSTLKSR
jgi:Ca2+-transporting ATPase